MIIEVTRDKQNISINRDFASAVSEFAEVLNDERLGVNAMAYVIYCLDPADNNLWYALPEEIRKKEVAESLKIETALLKDKKVLAAMKKYKLFVEQNIGYQFKESYIGGMKKVSDYVSGKKKLSEEDAKEFSAVLKEMPNLLKGKGDLEKLSQKEEAKGSVRGKKTLTLNEQMAN